MLRMLLCGVLAVGVVAGSALAKDTAKKEGPQKPKKTAEEIFKAKDKDGDGKLTLEELTSKVKKPEVAARLEKRFKAKDKDGDGMLTLEEFKAKPERKAKGKKKDKPADKQ